LKKILCFEQASYREILIQIFQVNADSTADEPPVFSLGRGGQKPSYLCSKSNTDGIVFSLDDSATPLQDRLV
jgi:hypothetical protein